MPAKVCPRCGAQYATLKSTTCPQCFAKLIEVDDQLAEELTAARTAVEQTPEFQQAKAEDDEQFREQSFSACLGVLGIALLTVIIITVIIILGIHREHIRKAHLPHLPAVIVDISHQQQVPNPLVGATLEEVMPINVGNYGRAQLDQDVKLVGTIIPIYHARYSRSPTGRAQVEVYAIPSGISAEERQQFDLGILLMAHLDNVGPVLFFNTENWHYAVFTSERWHNFANGTPEYDSVSAQEFQSALISFFGSATRG